MNKILPGCLMLLICFLSACATSSDNEKIETNRKLEDLNYFHEMLEVNHKNFYAHISKEEFIEEKNKIAKKTPTMSDAEFYFSLKYLLSIVGDAHTTIYPIDANSNTLFYPEYLDRLGFVIKKFDDGWYLLLLEKENEEYLGNILISINNIPIEDIFTASKNIISHENETWVENQFSSAIRTRQALEYLKIIKGDETVILQAKDKGGQIHDIELSPMNTQEKTNTAPAMVEHSFIPQTWPSGIYRAMELDDTTYFIQYNVCVEAPDLPMKDFVSIVQDDLSKKDYQDIIVDLRYNGGGDSRIFEPMITMLQTLQNEDAFTVYTLIGSDTFSSALLNSLEIQSKLDSVLVGTPTGQNVNAYGELQSFKLKNSPIGVMYSTKYFEMIKGYERDSLYPDIEVTQTFDNYLNGIDAEIEAIKNLRN